MRNHGRRPPGEPGSSTPSARPPSRKTRPRKCPVNGRQAGHRRSSPERHSRPLLLSSGRPGVPAAFTPGLRGHRGLSRSRAEPRSGPRSLRQSLAPGDQLTGGGRLSATEAGRWTRTLGCSAAVGGCEARRSRRWHVADHDEMPSATMPAPHPFRGFAEPLWARVPRCACGAPLLTTPPHPSGLGEVVNNRDPGLVVVDGWGCGAGVWLVMVVGLVCRWMV